MHHAKSFLGLCAVVASALVSGCGTDAVTGDEQNLIGGKAESRYLAVGYLAVAGEDDIACGATLIAPNVVVTAAHCAYRVKDEALEFGVGEVDDQERYAVRSVVNHPEAHLEAEGSWDLAHALLLNDIAYLVLEESVYGVEPAALATKKPRMGDEVRLIAYGTESGRYERRGARGQVVLNAKLGSDDIVEIRPRDGAKVCHRDGDEGHAAITVDANGRPVLVGIYVGSVTQSFTDCSWGQFLNGYEATFGHRDFYEDGIADGDAARSSDEF